MRSRKEWNGEEIHQFQRRLLHWFSKHKRALPWRSNPSPYRVWISEIMLQQTQAGTVVRYFEPFIERFPDIESLARASEEEVLTYWSGLGYYSRARNLHRAAKLIAGIHDGVFPHKLKEIRSLPGVGRYTAGAIGSIAFNQPQPIVDGNIRRLVNRLHGLRRRVPEKFFWRQVSLWIPKKRASSFNQAMMELGALVCIPSRPRCPRCPVRVFCKAWELGIQDSIPRSRARSPIHDVEIVLLVIENKGKALLTSINKASYIPGEWVLPTQSLTNHISPEDVASCLCLKIFGRPITIRYCGRLRHSISNHRIQAHVFSGKGTGSGSSLSKTTGFQWVDSLILGRMLTSSLFRKALQKHIDQAREG
jgi:A/G-specific adenine glycosylase